MIDYTPILILVPGFPADESDSSCLPAIQNYVEALGNRLAPASVDVVAFQYPFVRRSYQWHGARVHALGGGNVRRAKPRTWMRAVHTGRRLIAGRGSGIIHSFWLGECALVGSLLARRVGWKHIVSVGGQEVRRSTMYGLLLRHAAFSLTAGSTAAAEAVRRNLHRDVDAVIPIGLDTDRPAIEARQPRANSRPIDLLVVGSLIPVKRVDEVIDVAAKLVELRPNLTVEIVGEGPERSQLQDRIRRTGLGNHVVLRGLMPREEVLRLMRRSKILLHPSEYESQGYVFLEALASGMYVVCRQVGFHPESPNVDHATTVEQMAAAVARRLDHPHNPDPVTVPTVHQTIEAFAALYQA